MIDGGVLLGADVATLILVTGTLGNFVRGQIKKKTAVHTQKTRKIQRFGYPVLRSKPWQWIPELRFGYPPPRKSFCEKLGGSLESLGLSERQLCITTLPLPLETRFLHIVFRNPV